MKSLYSLFQEYIIACQTYFNYVLYSSPNKLNCWIDILSGTLVSFTSTFSRNSILGKRQEEIFLCSVIMKDNPFKQSKYVHGISKRR